jgi:hypothetical protein
MRTLREASVEASRIFAPEAKRITAGKQNLIGSSEGGTSKGHLLLNLICWVGAVCFVANSAKIELSSLNRTAHSM